MAKRSAAGSTSSTTVTSANPKEETTSPRKTRKVAATKRAKNEVAPKSKSGASVPMSRTATDGSGSTASRSRRIAAAPSTKRKYVESSDSEEEQDAASDASEFSSSGDSDDPDAVSVAVSRESSVLPAATSKPDIGRPSRKKAKHTHSPEKKSKKGKTSIATSKLEANSERSDSVAPKEGMPANPLKIKIATKRSAEPDGESSSCLVSPMPFVLRALVKPKPETIDEEPSKALLAAYTENASDMEISDDSLHSGRIPDLDVSYHTVTKEGETTQDTTIPADSTGLSVEPDAKSVVSDVDYLSVQADDERTPAVTPAEEKQVELALPQNATPVKRKRGRPKKNANVAFPAPASAQSSRAPSAAPSIPDVPSPNSNKLVTEPPRLQRRKSAVEAAGLKADQLQETLDYERRLIEQGEHPLFIEALAPWNDMKLERLREFELLQQAKLRTRERILEADEQQKWIQWQDSKRALWFEILHSLESKNQKLELEYGDDEYSSVMCPIVKVQKAPDVLPVVRLELEDGLITTISPLNDTMATHGALDICVDDINTDLRIMGLVRETITDKQRQQQQLRKLKAFPLGAGPVKPKVVKPKARFLDSRHPLRQLEPAVGAVREDVPSVLRQNASVSVVVEAQRHTSGKGGSKADAILIGDDIPGTAPLTMESLAALEREAARSENIPLYSGRQYAEMPRFPGRPAVYDPAIPSARPDMYGYYGGPPPPPRQTHLYGDPRFPHGLPIGPEFDIARDKPDRIATAERQAAFPAPPPDQKATRRADLAQQARIQLGLDPPTPVTRSRADGRSPPPPAHSQGTRDQAKDPRQHPQHDLRRPPPPPIHPHQQNHPHHPYPHQARRPSQHMMPGYPPPDWPYRQQYPGMQASYGWPGDYPPPPPRSGYPPHHDPRMDYPPHPQYGHVPSSPPPPPPPAQARYYGPGSYYPPIGYPPYVPYPESQQVPRRSMGSFPENRAGDARSAGTKEQQRPADPPSGRTDYYRRWGQEVA